MPFLISQTPDLFQQDILSAIAYAKKRSGNANPQQTGL